MAPGNPRLLARGALQASPVEDSDLLFLSIAMITSLFQLSQHSRCRFTVDTQVLGHLSVRHVGYTLVSGIFEKQLRQPRNQMPE